MSETASRLISDLERQRLGADGGGSSASSLVGFAGLVRFGAVGFSASSSVSSSDTDPLDVLSKRLLRRGGATYRTFS